MDEITRNEELLQFVEEKKFRVLKNVLSEMNEFDVAEFIGELDPEKMVVVFRMLPKELATEVFACLEPDVQERIINDINDKELGTIIEDLYIDDAVDMLEEMPANIVRRVLKQATPTTRAQINEFLKYPENSAGSIMTAEYIGIRKTMTVEEAVEYIRKYGTDKEYIYTAYVMDNKRTLEGVVTIRDLMMNPKDMLIENIMDDHVIKTVTTDDQEHVAELFSNYDLMALPVVDLENRLVGIITVDDVVDVMEEEATEDFEKMAAMLPSEKPYLKEDVFTIAKQRVPWLLVLMISSMITGAILAKYEKAFQVLPILVTFIPMLMDTGGNAGSQTSTTIIRGMAVGDIDTGDVLKAWWKELRIAVIVGAALCIVNFVRLIIQYPNQLMVNITVVLSLYITVIIAKSLGCLLPIGAKKLNLDPAIMASPLITTLVDAISLTVYFGFAVALLHI